MTDDLEKISTQYDEAVKGLNKFFNEKNLEPWQPDKAKTMVNSRCLYLYGDSNQYAKFDLRLKVVIEYFVPGLPRMRDVARREGDLGQKPMPNSPGEEHKSTKSRAIKG